MKLDIRTIPVSIQVITIDNKRMTKSIFNQIQKENCFDRNYYFLGNDILGYVFDKDQKQHVDLREVAVTVAGLTAGSLKNRLKFFLKRTFLKKPHQTQKHDIFFLSCD